MQRRLCPVPHSRRKLDALRLGYHGRLAVVVVAVVIVVVVVLVGPFQDQVSSVQVGASKGLLRVRGIGGVSVLDKGKTTVSTVHALRQAYFVQRPKRTEQLQQFLPIGLKWDVSYHEFGWSGWLVRGGEVCGHGTTTTTVVRGWL